LWVAALSSGLAAAEDRPLKRLHRLQAISEHGVPFSAGSPKPAGLPFWQNWPGMVKLAERGGAPRYFAAGHPNPHGCFTEDPSDV
jgi:hypothetical protein